MGEYADWRNSGQHLLLFLFEDALEERKRDKGGAQNVRIKRIGAQKLSQNLLLMSFELVTFANKS